MIDRATFLSSALSSLALTGLGSPQNHEAVVADIDVKSIKDFGTAPAAYRVDETGAFPGGLISDGSIPAASTMLGGSKSLATKNHSALITAIPNYLSPSNVTFKDGHDVALLQFLLAHHVPLDQLQKQNQLLSWTNLWSLIHRKGAQLARGPLDFGGGINRITEIPFDGGEGQLALSLLYGNTNSNTADAIQGVFDKFNQALGVLGASTSIVAIPAADVVLSKSLMQLITGLVSLGNRPEFNYEIGQGTKRFFFHHATENSAGFGDMVLPAGQSYWILVKDSDGPTLVQLVNDVYNKTQGRLAIDHADGHPKIVDPAGNEVQNTDLLKLTLVVVTFKVDAVT